MASKKNSTGTNRVVLRISGDEEKSKRPSKAEEALQKLSTAPNPPPAAAQEAIEYTPGSIMDQYFAAIVEQLDALEQQVDTLTKLAKENGWFGKERIFSPASLKRASESIATNIEQEGRVIINRGRGGVGIVVKPREED